MNNLVVRHLILMTAIIMLCAQSCKKPKADTIKGLISKDLEIANLEGLLKERPDVILLDVRTPKEVAGGKIPNAKEIDYRSNDFEEKIAKLDKNKSYVIYCKSGGRSSKVLAIMKEKEFKECYNLVGGYTAYAKK